MAVGTRMQQRRATAAVWATSGYILAPGEIGITTDTGIMKVGNGTSPWNSLGVAFESQYLPLLGTAANASLLGGVGPSSYVKFTDTDTAATADKIVKRLGDGRAKAVAGTATDDVVNLSQLTSSFISRTVTATFTLALTDVGKMIIGNSSAYATSLTCNVPLNSSVAFPIGSFVDIHAGDKGPIVLTPAGGVTINGNIPVYGGGSQVRLVKTGTDTWRVVNVSLSPPPLLHRNIKSGSDNTVNAGGFVTLRLDAADNSAHPYSDNKDTLGAGEQWSSAANTKCYCRRSGYYDVRMQVSLSATSTGRLFVEPYFNGNGGGDYLGGGTPLSGQNDVAVHYSALIPITVGDYMELAAYQEGISSPTVQQQAYVNSFVEWVWRRPL
jgi:hypothetical protein